MDVRSLEVNAAGDRWRAWDSMVTIRPSARPHLSRACRNVSLARGRAGAMALGWECVAGVGAQGDEAAGVERANRRSRVSARNPSCGSEAVEMAPWAQRLLGECEECVGLSSMYLWPSCKPSAQEMRPGVPGASWLARLAKSLSSRLKWNILL